MGLSLPVLTELETVLLQLIQIIGVSFQEKHFMSVSDSKLIFKRKHNVRSYIVASRNYFDLKIKFLGFLVFEVVSLLNFY